ncbi:MAG: hypothetical protein QXQ53_04855 [Candidatus Methanosuratincola sp.]
MSLSITINDHTIFGNKRFVTFTIAFDSSYPTGGESLTAANLGLSSIDFLLVEPAHGLLFEYVHSTSKLKAMYPSVTHTHTITIKGGESGTVAIGIASDANNSYLSKTSSTDRTGITGIQNASASAATEVPNGTDLSSLTDVRGFAIGS